MNGKYVVIFLAIVLGLLMVSLPYFYNDALANDEAEKSIRAIDSDGDHLCDYYEEEIGTNPFLADSDHDLIPDLEELYLGTSPTDWDTDDDHLADGNEIGRSRKSTSAFSKDSDSDGLPDPWEDNDGDGILNREEQLPIHDGLMFYTDMFFEAADRQIPMTPDPNNADTDGDGWDDGYEIQVNSTAQGGINNPPPVDRNNPNLDVSSTSNWAYRFLTQVGGWDTATFADWRAGLKLAGNYNLIPRQCTNIAWYHFSPWYRYEQLVELGNINPNTLNFTSWKQQQFHGNNEQVLGAMDRGSPYDWNNYDCDPTLNDTDTDVMDDNWDPYPLRINLRNGTFAAINSVQRVGGQLIKASTPTGDPWNFFGMNISILELNKGDMVDINISIGLQDCDPLNATHENFKKGYYSPMQVVVRFRPIGLGPDGEPHTGDDDTENFTNVAHLTRTFDNFDNAHVVPTMRHQPFTNHLGISTNITFFYQTFRLRIPSRVPAGHIAITVETQCDNNFHYFPSDPYIVY